MLRAEHLPFLKTLNIAHYDPTVNPYLSPALLAEKCPCPFEYHIHAWEIYDLTADQLEAKYRDYARYRPAVIGFYMDRLRDACEAAEAANHDLQIMMRRVSDHRGIAVFGAGAGGRRFAARWRSAGGSVACFSDNRRDLWGSRLEGVPVIAPGDLAVSGVALVAIASSIGSQQIAAQLKGLGLPAGLDVVNGAAFIS